MYLERIRLSIVEHLGQAIVVVSVDGQVEYSWITKETEAVNY